MSTGRNTPRGQRRSAWKMGMALWTPMARASYEHAETTPRPPRSPPTITGRPRSSGRRACSTEAKKASMSRCRIARCDTNICSYLTPRGTDGQSSREGGAAQGRLHVQRRQTASALHGKVEPWDVAPQRLEAIEVARRRREDVHDHIDEVEQDPLGFALALNARRTPSRAELALDLLGDGFGLAGVDAVSWTDFFVIATGANPRQTKAIAEEIEGKLRSRRRAARVEGKREAEWILLDFIDVVVQ